MCKPYVVRCYFDDKLHVALNAESLQKLCFPRNLLNQSNELWCVWLTYSSIFVMRYFHRFLILCRFVEYLCVCKLFWVPQFWCCHHSNGQKATECGCSSEKTPIYWLVGRLALFDKNFHWFESCFNFLLCFPECNAVYVIIAWFQIFSHTQNHDFKWWWWLN